MEVRLRVGKRQSFHKATISHPFHYQNTSNCIISVRRTRQAPFPFHTGAVIARMRSKAPLHQMKQ